jgi:hypothetical protein
MKTHNHKWKSVGVNSSSMESFKWCKKCGALQVTEMHYGYKDRIKIIRPRM